MFCSMNYANNMSAGPVQFAYRENELRMQRSLANAARKAPDIAKFMQVPSHECRNIAWRGIPLQ
jgi:hypothetical protein